MAEKRVLEHVLLHTMHHCTNSVQIVALHWAPCCRAWCLTVCHTLQLSSKALHRQSKRSAALCVPPAANQDAKP